MSGAVDEIEGLVPDPQVQREFGVSAMTIWRWDMDPTLGFPPPVKIRKRKFRSRRALEQLQARLVEGRHRAAQPY